MPNILEILLKNSPASHRCYPCDAAKVGAWAVICQGSASCVMYAVAGMEADFIFTPAFWIGILWLFCANVASLSHSVPSLFTGMPSPLTYKLNVPLFGIKQDLLNMNFMEVTQERLYYLLHTLFTQPPYQEYIVF